MSFRVQGDFEHISRLQESQRQKDIFVRFINRYVFETVTVASIPLITAFFQDLHLQKSAR